MSVSWVCTTLTFLPVSFSSQSPKMPPIAVSNALDSVPDDAMDGDSQNWNASLYMTTLAPSQTRLAPMDTPQSELKRTERQEISGGAVLVLSPSPHDGRLGITKLLRKERDLETERRLEMDSFEIRRRREDDDWRMDQFLPYIPGYLRVHIVHITAYFAAESRRGFWNSNSRKTSIYVPGTTQITADLRIEHILGDAGRLV
jgi:hypothetical protein